MRITPNKPHIAHKEINPKSKKLSDKSLNKNIDSPVKKETAPAKLLFDKDEIVSLASDLKSGYIDKNQANESFVSSIVENSLADNLNPNDKKLMIKAIADLLKEDKHFMDQLDCSLKKLR